MEINDIEKELSRLADAIYLLACCVESGKTKDITTQIAEILWKRP